MALLLPTDTDCSSNCLSPKHRTFVISRAQTFTQTPTFVLSRAQTVFHPNTTRLSYLALRLSFTQTLHVCLISHSDFHPNSTLCLICLLSKHHTLSLALTPMSAENGIQFLKFLCFSRRFQFQCVTQEEPVGV